MDRILVTGGAGLIGSHLCEHLLRWGKQVAVVDDLDDFYDPRLKLANLEEIKLSGKCDSFIVDIRDGGQLQEVFEKVEPHAPLLAFGQIAEEGARGIEAASGLQPAADPSAASGQGPGADPQRLAELEQLREQIDPFELARTIDRKLERIHALAHRRLSPKAAGPGSVTFQMARHIHRKVTFLNGLIGGTPERL